MATKDNLKEPRTMTLSKSKEAEIRSRPGGSNAGQYPHVAESNFAGNACGLPGSYLINTIERARSALAYAHNAKDLECIRRQVYKKYPSLKPTAKK